MDRVDNAIEKHSMKLFRKSLMQNQGFPSKRTSQSVRKTPQTSKATTPKPHRASQQRTQVIELQKSSNPSSTQQIVVPSPPSHFRARTMMNMTLHQVQKPKKTILVKVSRNDALPSTHDLATRQEEDEIMQAHRNTLSPGKNFNM